MPGAVQWKGVADLIAGGAMLFWFMARRHRTPGTRGHTLWVETQEPICAGLIAGAALIGIGDTLVRVFVLG
jgi:hypothetical protein